MCLTLCDPMHARLPCPSLSPWVCSNSCPLSQGCHSNIPSSVTPFSSCPQSFPTSGYFHMSQFFASAGQSTGASASASVLPMNIQGWFPLGLTGLISLLSRGLSKFFSSNTVYYYFLIIYLFCFTTLYWFCHTLTWICHGCTCVTHPEPASQLPPHPIPLGHPSAPAPSILYHASNLDWFD